MVAALVVGVIATLLVLVALLRPTRRLPLGVPVRSRTFPELKGIVVAPDERHRQSPNYVVIELPNGNQWWRPSGDVVALPHPRKPSPRTAAQLPRTDARPHDHNASGTGL